MTKIIAFQGTFGAYSHLACQEIFPNDTYLPCFDFSNAFTAVQDETADFAVIPIENSNAGRVADVHFLLSQTPLYITGEYFLPINHQLLGLPETNLEQITQVISHPQALSQCSNFLKQHDIKPIAKDDTALSCRILTHTKDMTTAAIASSSAAQIYGLKILAPNIENSANNTTRFLIMSKKNNMLENNGQKFITSLIFTAKNIPAALYKALGCFALNNINITKIESYILDDKFISAQFYLEIEAHQNDITFKNAINELQFFSKKYSILGSYPAHPYRYL
ncbi:MAG: prephenate dehydratase [Alphaproteobacteria bacterium]|nr:prephenate dehydratase [Alphaproteobacteria bacterium]